VWVLYRDEQDYTQARRAAWPPDPREEPAMHLEFLLEEPSAEAALNNLLPQIVGQSATFALHSYQGKPDLLAKLPGRLRGYRAWLPPDWHVVVLVDRDADDCYMLKAHLEQVAREAGLLTKSAAQPDQRFRVLNRLVIEELEAWFFGDVAALHAAYRRISPTLGKQARYRDPDAIKGGTWEALALLLHSYYPTGLPKVEVARTVSALMEPERNRSHSFQVFWQGLLALIGQ